jgi:hypothetical protein
MALPEGGQQRILYPLLELQLIDIIDVLRSCCSHVASTHEPQRDRYQREQHSDQHDLDEDQQLHSPRPSVSVTDGLDA